MIRVRLVNDQLLFPVRVTPRGGIDVLLPFEVGDNALKIKVSAPPEDGKANAAIIKLLAESLAIPKSRISIASGEKARHKQVAVLLRDTDEAKAIIERLGVVFHVSSSAWCELEDV